MKRLFVGLLISCLCMSVGNSFASDADVGQKAKSEIVKESTDFCQYVFDYEMVNVEFTFISEGKSTRCVVPVKCDSASNKKFHDLTYRRARDGISCRNK